VKKLVRLPIPKTELANQLGVSRSIFYYQPRLPQKDEGLKFQIEQVMENNQAYGHKRIALALGINKKRALRVMKKFGIKPYKRRSKFTKLEDQNKPALSYPNLVKKLCPIAPNVVWATDFTYLEYQNKFLYLSTVIDVFTREILGWNISFARNQYLMLGALINAFNMTKTKPHIHHSDQGSGYDSNEYLDQLKNKGIQISMSAKASPWENPFQESYYSQFKLELGQTNRFNTLGELIEAIHLTISNYNQTRIHTKLKMSPRQFKQNYYQRLNQTIQVTQNINLTNQTTDQVGFRQVVEKMGT